MAFLKGHKKPEGAGSFQKGHLLTSGCFKPGHKINLGKTHSEETKQKQRERMKGNTRGFQKGNKLNVGENNPSWKGGIAYFPYPDEWKDDLKESIRKRDNYTCQECGTHQDELNRKLHIHHIDYNKDNLSENNLISLCNSCHNKTNFNRDYWVHYFNN